MAALTKDRNTPRASGEHGEGPVAANAFIFAGAILMRDAAGNLTQGQTAAGLVGVGRAEARVDNSGGAAGDATATYRPGIYRYANSAGADEVDGAAVGGLCYAVDDQTVAKTDGGGARSPAGIVDAVDSVGVWVRFDEALTAAS